MNAAAPLTQSGAYFDIIWGTEVPLIPHIEMSMKADIAHQFWHRKINRVTALIQRQIVAKGPIPKIFKPLPAVELMYELYPRILRQSGRDDMVLV